MENTNKRNPWYLVAGITCLILAGIMLFAVSKSLSNSIDEMNAKTEEFYEPYWINDTTMHLNVSESTCLLFEIENDTCYISANGIEHFSVDDNVVKVHYHEGKEFKQKEIYLDSIDGFDYENVYVN